MTMGNVISRLAMVIRTRRVTSNQVNVPQRNSSYATCNEKEECANEVDNSDAEQCSKSISIVQSVEQYGDVPEISQQTRTKSRDINSQAVEDGQNREMVSSNECQNDHKEKIFCDDNDKEEAVSSKESFIKDFEEEHEILNTGNTLNTGSISGSPCSPNKAECFLQKNDGQKEKIDTLSCISRDGYSTEGTAGSGSFGDRDEDIINRLLVDNIDDVGGIDSGNFDEAASGRRSSLTPFSLETLNCCELDKQECVRSYIQAWSPLDLPSAGTYSNSLPGTCIGPVEPTSSESYDRFPSTYEDSRASPNELQELHETDSQEFGLFYHREPEPMSRPLSDSWSLLKNDRAPWINFGSTGSKELTEGREGVIEDDQDIGWPKAKADSWQDPTKGLTICSLSTINEESEDVDRSYT